MSRLKMTDSTMDIVIKMSDGNPGAMSTVMELLQEVNKDIRNIGVILFLDSPLELYGSQLYQLWNDCCGRDIQKVIKIVNLCAKGEITKDEFLRHVNQPYGIPFEILEVPTD